MSCPEAAAPLEAGQVRVAVRAAGLNVRDVLIALGMYPGAAVMGSEIAGIVAETGPGVTGLAAGDRVMGLAGGGFGPVAVTDARLLARIPAGWSFAQAAALPVSFLPGEADPGRLGRALAQVAGLLAAGELDPLPVRAWDVRRAPEAFGFVSQAGQAGKVGADHPAGSGRAAPGRDGAGHRRDRDAGRPGGRAPGRHRAGPAPGAGQPVGPGRGRARPRWPRTWLPAAPGCRWPPVTPPTGRAGRAAGPGPGGVPADRGDPHGRGAGRRGDRVADPGAGGRR